MAALPPADVAMRPSIVYSTSLHTLIVGSNRVSSSAACQWVVARRRRNRPAAARTKTPVQSPTTLASAWTRSKAAAIAGGRGSSGRSPSAVSEGGMITVSASAMTSGP